VVDGCRVDGFLTSRYTNGGHIKKYLGFLMRTPMLGCFLALTALQVFAAGFGFKPGLWETRIVKQTKDGQDTTAELMGAMTQMQQRLANMPPEQRAKLEAMMNANGASTGNGAMRMCLTAEMLSDDKQLVAREGCPPAKMTHSGNHSSFEFSCSTNGNTTNGKGESTSAGDTHVMHVETEMKFLGADCGNVKPMTPPKASP
jgi:Protein of unknown function (DUF3617)